MDVPLTVVQRKMINKIAQIQGIKDFQVETKSGGEGSFGSIIAVTIKNEKEKIDLILKSASTNPIVRYLKTVRGTYLREIYVYYVILPTFKKFQEEVGYADGFSSYPKIYGRFQGYGDECLALENLNEIGYKMWDRKVPMDSDHVSLVFKEYAKFHAVSFAMTMKLPDLYFELTKDLTNVFGGNSLAIAKTAWEYGRKAVEGNIIATEALDRLSGVVDNFLLEELERHEGKVVVIHIDGWCNNVMFNYEDKADSTKPMKTRIIDWQLTENGSPLLDLAYFMFTCGSTEIIKNYKIFLEVYHSALTESLSKMSCDVNAIYPIESLFLHWEKYCKFGLFMAIVMIKFMLSENNKVSNISQMPRPGMSFVDRLNFESIHNDECNKRISDIITVMAESCLI